ncbi:DUF4313 domain-containing protein [Bacteroides uniformis]|nr:DUF4313 domain-containing protein [Bacteroides uniformis]
MGLLSPENDNVTSWGSFTDVTVNMRPLPPYYAFVKEYSENEGMGEFLTRNGIACRSHVIPDIQNGFVTMHAYLFDRERLALLAPDTFPDYEKKPCGRMIPTTMEVKQENKGIGVRLNHIRHGECMEVWQLQTPEGKPKRYVCRDTYGENCWYWLCDAPSGCCERDYAINNDIAITVCDQSWREITRDSNNRRRYAKSFATLEDTYTEEWRKIAGNYPGVTRNGFKEWILKQSFRPLNGTEEANWQYCRHETVASETLAHFTWIGEKYAICRVTQKHTECDARWYEYYARKVQGIYYGHTHFFGYEFHDRHISDVLRTLGKRCEDIGSTVVETRYRKGHSAMSYFMDEFIGYDLSYEQVRDAKECRLRKAREDYNGANTYYYKLKENEVSVRGIEAILLAMRKQMLKAKKQ